jgi:apolipoprotein N-acyltransferase
MTAFAAWVGGLAGWRRHGFVIVLGLLSAAAFAPTFVLPALLAFVPLFWLLRAATSWWGAFALAWCFAFGQFVAGLYWTGIAFLVDVEKFAILLPFPILGLPAALAFIPAFCAAVGWRLRHDGAIGAFVFALAWTMAEYARGHLLTGFPWNLTGHAWALSAATMQPAAWIGVYGLSLLTLFAVALVAARHLAAGVVLLALVPLAGVARLSTASDAVVPGVQLRLVQAAISQHDKWDGDQRLPHVIRHINLSLGPAAVPPTHIVWPESAIPFFVEGDGRALAMLAGALPPGGLLLAGAPRRTPESEPLRLWNSLLAIDDRGTVLDAYDKRHLVPFGEYLPFRNVLSRIGIDKLVPGSIDYSPGDGLHELTLPGLPPMRALVCYEAIFADQIAVPGEGRPGLLLNVTNDGWFGRSSGPHQHLAMARFRTVEQGVPLVRAANTGISAIVDAHGRVTASLGLGQTGVVDGPLPAAAAAPVYARWGDWLLLGLAGLLGIVASVLHRRR